MVWYGDRPAYHFMRSTIRNTPPCQDYHFPMSGIRGCTIRPTYPRHGTYDTAMSGIRGFRLALRTIVFPPPLSSICRKSVAFFDFRVRFPQEGCKNVFSQLLFQLQLSVQPIMDLDFICFTNMPSNYSKIINLIC